MVLIKTNIFESVAISSTIWSNQSRTFEDAWTDASEFQESEWDRLVTDRAVQLSAYN